MQYSFFIILLSILTIKTSTCLAFSKSADQLYAEIVKFENNGNLPSYITETKPIQDKLYSPPKQQSRIQAVKEFNEEIYVAPERLPSPFEERSWSDVVKSVASGNPSAFDINFIKKLVEVNDPKATELLAWMYAKGVGVPKKSKTAWFLYMKATNLGVENAKENAEKVYNSMSKAEISEILEF